MCSNQIVSLFSVKKKKRLLINQTLSCLVLSSCLFPASFTFFLYSDAVQVPVFRCPQRSTRLFAVRHPGQPIPLCLVRKRLHLRGPVRRTAARQTGGQLPTAEDRLRKCTPFCLFYLKVFFSIEFSALK